MWLLMEKFAYSDLGTCLKSFDVTGVISVFVGASG